jgi:LysM repeat protein
MFNTNSNLLTKSGLTAAQIDELLASEGDFAGLGASFIEVEEKYGINAFWGIAQCTQEVGWSGHSWIADNKHNLFGLDAYDAAPEADASVFPDFATCVLDWGLFLNDEYLHVGGAYFVSATPAGVARHYASDPNYAAEVTSIMNIYYGRSQQAGHTPAAPVTPPAPVAPAHGTYIVQKGDTLSGIASKLGETLATLEQLNPHAGHPAGNFNVIWPGDVLVVAGSPAPEEPITEYYTVESGDNLSVIAERHGISLAEIEGLNPQIKNPNLIYPGESVRVK